MKNFEQLNIKALVAIILITLTSCATVIKSSNQRFEKEKKFVDTVIIKTNTPKIDIKKLRASLVRLGYQVTTFDAENGLIQTDLKKWGDTSFHYLDKFIVTHIEGEIYINSTIVIPGLDLTTRSRNYGDKDSPFKMSWGRVNMMSSTLNKDMEYLIGEDFSHYF